MNWKALPHAATYLTQLNTAELLHGIPNDLLARIAAEESNFRDDVVLGPANSMGCRGLMQLNTRYYPNVGVSWQQDIQDAAKLLVDNFHRFQDWQLAVAAYNDGAGNVHQYELGNRELPAETLTYVTQVCTDVPVPGRIITGVA